MAERLGADVDALNRLSAAFGAASGDLERIGSTLRARVHSVRWEGPDGQAVRTECDFRWGPLLGDAAQRLADVQRLLDAQVAQQLQASGEAPGVTPSWTDRVRSWFVRNGDALSRSWETVSGFAKPVLDAVAQPIALMGIAGVLVAKASTVGRYSTAWTKAIAKHRDLLRYKTSPFLQAVAGSPTLGFLSKVGSSGLVTQVGKAAGVVGRVLSAGDIANDLAHRRYLGAADKVVDLGASALKESRNPVGYLLGVNVSLWKEVGVQASQQRLADWTTPLPNPFSGHNFRDVYLKTAGETALALGALVPKIAL